MCFRSHYNMRCILKFLRNSYVLILFVVQLDFGEVTNSFPVNYLYFRRKILRIQ